MSAIACGECGHDGVRRIKTRDGLTTITCPAGHRETLRPEALEHAAWWQRVQQSADDTAKEAVKDARRKRRNTTPPVPMSRTVGAERAARLRNLEARLRAHRVKQTQQEPCSQCGGGNPVLGCEDRDTCRCGSRWGDTLAARCHQQADEAWRRRIAHTGHDTEESA